MEDQVSPRRRGVALILYNIKDILTSVAGIVTVLASFGLGVGADRVAHSQSPTATQPPVTITVSALPASNTPTLTPSFSSTPSLSSPPPTSADPAKVTKLSAINPIQTKNVSNPIAGSVQVGTATYPNSIRFTCNGAYPGDVVYNVARFKFLNATIGVPNDARNAAGNTTVITFLKDSSAAQPLGSPLNVAVGQPQLVHLDLQGATQLDIHCVATNNATHSVAIMDIVLGDAEISPS